MQTITITPHLENGRFYIDLPEDITYDDFTIQIIVKKNKTKSYPTADKLEKVKAFAGIASYSDYKSDKAEWYQQ